MTGYPREDCPCVVRLKLKKREVFYIFPSLELHDSNEWERFRSVVKTCRDAACGCVENNLVDCIYRCEDGRVVGVEFKSRFDPQPTPKRTGCGVNATHIVVVVVGAGAVPPGAPSELVLAEPSRLCNDAWLKVQLCR